MLEIPNLSVWKRTVLSKFPYNRERNIRNTQTIKLRPVVRNYKENGVEMTRTDTWFSIDDEDNRLSDSNFERFDTLQQAKDFLRGVGSHVIGDIKHGRTWKNVQPFHAEMV